MDGQNLLPDEHRPPPDIPKKTVETKPQNTGRLVPCIIFFIIVMCIMLVSKSAFDSSDHAAERLQLSIGPTVCGNATNYFTPFDFGIHQCFSGKVRISDVNTIRMNLISSLLPCHMCPVSDTNCTPTYCIPRHLAVSYDSVGMLATMMGAWCAQNKFANNLDKGLNVTLSASHLAEWTHDLTRADAAASLLMMTPHSQHNDVGKTCSAARKFAYKNGL